MPLPGGPERGVSLVAVGGYGRSELSPESDLDLLLLHERGHDVNKLAGELWYPVWNEGLKLGHAVRTVPETLQLASDDLDTATSLLSARHVAGDPSLAERLAGSARDQWSRRARRWLPQLAQDARWRELEHGEVAFRLQPDLKESTGGMRDLQALRYVALARPDLADPDSALVDDAHETLLATRVELHRVTGNARNLPHPGGAARRGCGARSRLGRGVHDHRCRRGPHGRLGGRRDLGPHRALGIPAGACGGAARRSQPLEPGVQIHPDRNEVRLPAGAGVARRPAAGAAGGGRGGEPGCPHRARVPAAARRRHGPRSGDPWPPGARELFVDLLACGRNAIPVIEALDQVGAVVKILPEWETCRSRLQRNDYHRFTVDRHLCETAAQAADMIAGGEVSVRRGDLLLVASLLHDIGKGYPGDHTEVGMELMEVIGRRMGFDGDEVATLVRLVELHLLLPDVATRRDIDEIGTVRRVAEQVRSVEMLELLAALTEADAISTGPSVWTRLEGRPGAGPGAPHRELPPQRRAGRGARIVPHP